MSALEILNGSGLKPALPPCQVKLTCAESWVSENCDGCHVVDVKKFIVCLKKY